MKAESDLVGRAGPEDIRPQLAASDLAIGDRFDGRPVLGVQKNPSLEPVGDGLLFQSRPPHDVRQTLSEGSLAATGDTDGFAERDNVRFLHGHPLYTNAFVRVNEPVCVTGDKRACTVLQMPVIKRKNTPQPKPSSKRVALPGPDGKTLGERVELAMSREGGRRGIDYEQKDLIADVNALMQAEGDVSEPFSQQIASAIMRRKVSRSSFTPYIAKACHVDGVWLARGLGSMLPKG